MAQSDRPQAASPDAAQRAAPPTPTPATSGNSGQGSASTQASVVPGRPAPTEQEIRAAREVLKRAKDAGVKLPSGGGVGQPRVMLPNGEPRINFIKRRFSEKVSRGQILKELHGMGAPHDKCTYQIVFSATKGMQGGPDPVEGKASTAADKPAAGNPTPPSGSSGQPGSPTPV
jgi:hypothetical protein